MNLILSLLLWFGACLGHTVVMVFTMNWLYGCAFPKRAMKPVRKIYAIFLAVSCGWLTWLLVENDWDWWRLQADVPLALRSYVWFCWLAAFIVFPVATVANRLARNPAVLLSNHTQTVDMVKELGFKPVGLGRKRHLARLPFNQCFQVDFSERYLQLPQIPPSWDGLKILHVSDLHFCGTPDRCFYERVMQRCVTWEPDLVAITGDFVDTDQHHRWVVPVLGRLRWRLAGFAILGNHDAWRDPVLVRRRLRRIGLRVLGNGWETLEVRGAPMIVIGHEGPWFGPPPDVTTCPTDGFRLCLSHTPDNIGWAKRHHIDLVLAGHVHGGQIRLPVTGSIFVPSRYSRRYDTGTFHEGSTVMHVSRGLAGEVPLRYNCRPEVTLVVLRR
jgi:predicted MPP superfamily phosphohydrolase